MATKYGVNADKRLVDEPVTKINANQQRGAMRISYDEYEITADLASGDKIILGQLPKGAVVVNYQLAFDDLDGSGGTVDLGYEAADSSSSLTADPDAFLADVDVTSAGIVGMNEQAIVDRFGFAVTEDLNVILTTDGDTDATSGTIKVAVMYVLN